MKKCIKCHEIKPRTKEFFGKDKRLTSGLTNTCKKCKYENSRTWRDNKGAEYRSWDGIKERCNNKNSKIYEKYGARGITVCSRWENSFESFLEDMGRKPTPKHSIGRIDNDKGYYKENCRWEDDYQQAKNKRVSKRNKVGVTGVTWVGRRNRWYAIINVNHVQYNLGSFKKLKDAIDARKEAELKHWGKTNIS